MKSSPKNLYDFQITTKKELIKTSSSPMEIEMIQAKRSAEEIINEMIVEDIGIQILNVVNKSTEEYEEVIINPQFPDQKVKVGQEMPEKG